MTSIWYKLLNVTKTITDPSFYFLRCKTLYEQHLETFFCCSTLDITFQKVQRGANRGRNRKHENKTDFFHRFDIKDIHIAINIYAIM